MKKTAKLRKRINDYLFDHRVLKTILEYLTSFLFAAAGGILFAFGYTSFISNASSTVQLDLMIVTGGVSGLSQVAQYVVKMITNTEHVESLSYIHSIGYFVFNIPILIFAFFKISKRFGVFSAINVALTSIFMTVFEKVNFTSEIFEYMLENDGILSRVIGAALCTGVSSAICYLGDVSCGGIDIFSYYLGMKKSTSVGKYSVTINAIIITLYSVLLLIDTGDGGESLVSLFYSIVYLFICGLVIDFINLRNKKVQLQIITSNPKMSSILLTLFPHGATITHAVGAYTHNDKEVILMVVSNSEVKKVVNVAKKIDEHVFISTIPLGQVYGNFFNKPVA